MFEACNLETLEIVRLWVISVDNVAGSAVYFVKFYNQECWLVSPLCKFMYLDVACTISLLQTFIMLNEKSFLAHHNLLVFHYYFLFQFLF